MKKCYVLLLFTMLGFTINAQSVWDGTAMTWTKGDGTSTNPYLIENGQHLAYLSEQVRNGETYKNKFFKLNNDLDMGATADHKFLSLIHISSSVTLNVKDMPLQEVLNMLSVQTGLNFQRINNTISVNWETNSKQPIQSPKEKITGTIKDNNGDPVIGASIQVKNTGIGTITDYNGQFLLNNVPENGILIISYIGYDTEEIPVNKKKNLQIVMKENTKQLEEIVVVAYGTAKKSSFTGSAEVVKQDRIEKRVVADVSKALEGTVAVSYTHLTLKRIVSGLTLDITNIPAYVTSISLTAEQLVTASRATDGIPTLWQTAGDASSKLIGSRTPIAGKVKFNQYILAIPDARKTLFYLDVTYGGIPQRYTMQITNEPNVVSGNRITFSPNHWVKITGNFTNSGLVFILSGTINLDDNAWDGII